MSFHLPCALRSAFLPRLVKLSRVVYDCLVCLSLSIHDRVEFGRRKRAFRMSLFSRMSTENRSVLFHLAPRALYSYCQISLLFALERNMQRSEESLQNQSDMSRRVILKLINHSLIIPISTSIENVFIDHFLKRYTILNFFYYNGKLSDIR